jgi:fructoselysine and glucoselysine-specific PTS system IIA component
LEKSSVTQLYKIIADMTKTRKFLIVSHGALAGGFRSALELITGAAGDVFVIQAYLEENKPVEEELSRLLQNAGAEEEWVVFTDLLGGSITNQVLRVMAELPGRDVIHIVAGVNLPLVIEVVLGDPETPVTEVLAEAVGRARDQLVYVNGFIGKPNGENA